MILPLILGIENIATDPIVSKDMRDSEIKQEYLLFSFKSEDKGDIKNEVWKLCRICNVYNLYDK